MHLQFIYSAHEDNPRSLPAGTNPAGMTTFYENINFYCSFL